MVFIDLSYSGHRQWLHRWIPWDGTLFADLTPFWALRGGDLGFRPAALWPMRDPASLAAAAARGSSMAGGCTAAVNISRAQRNSGIDGCAGLLPPLTSWFVRSAVGVEKYFSAVVLANAMSAAGGVAPANEFGAVGRCGWEKGGLVRARRRIGVVRERKPVFQHTICA